MTGGKSLSHSISSAYRRSCGTCVRCRSGSEAPCRLRNGARRQCQSVFLRAQGPATANRCVVETLLYKRLRPSPRRQGESNGDQANLQPPTSVDSGGRAIANGKVIRRSPHALPMRIRKSISRSRVHHGSLLARLQMGRRTRSSPRHRRRASSCRRDARGSAQDVAHEVG